MFRLLSRSRNGRTFDSMFGEVELVQTQDSTGEDVTLLKLGESLQSATYHGDRWSYPPFAYIRAFDHVFESEATRSDAGMDPVRDILLLGGGGFSYPKHVLSSRKGVTMDVVEIDPAIVRIARKYFHLDRLERVLLLDGRMDHLEIFIEDGLLHLDGSHKRYDAVINDVFEAGRAVSGFADDEGIALVKEHLAEGGMYLSNVVVDLTKEGPAELNRFVRKLEGAFAYVNIVDACDEEFGGADNYIVIASDAEYAFTDVIPF